MNRTDMREAFEKWFSEDGKWSRGIERSGDGYKLMQTQDAWRIWQARQPEIDSLKEDATDYSQLPCAAQLEITQIKARLIAMISDDALAMSYQSLGQYRSALIQAISTEESANAS